MFDNENKRLAWERFAQNGRIEDYLKFRNVNLDLQASACQGESKDASEYRRDSNQIT